MTPGPFQIILIIVLVLLVFGTSRVPGMMENLAKGINSFKKGLKDSDAPDDKALEDAKDKKEE
ncbi:MAG: twin-arginine translocase TatA/TatE family subunit [Alphaproteobacteria bacterium]|nr:twin-arginine translocase TatA/TatE family subunit [Alphaproteobacteria bacterium]